MWVQQSVVNVQVQHLEVFGYGYSPNVNVRVQHMEVYESRYSPSVVNVLTVQVQQMEVYSVPVAACQCFPSSFGEE